ncbi:MAG: thiol:disulfide interchange protein DsbA/DsbL [Thermomonas sp.]|uniref:thiol:disulfide interchange protein DsbA/DsbL n=1 Tax=Thermomonas sp. TaxID=1971895 RepID=UPI00261C4FAB|nr:thiol:disulfide interchange protein DsbA/DsbL [Thermomonas sp.]MCC7097129.1 thiol:disulfide interchange protein DsbA/DsbL [Thermomonas sp.]
MTRIRHVLLLIALLPLAVACNREVPAPVAGNGAAPATHAGATTSAASVEDPQRAAAAAAAVKKAEEEAARLPPPVEGTDYVVIPNGQPYETPPGKVEVVEFFGYVCPFCAAVQPQVAAMKSKLPPDVQFVYIPAAFGGPWDNYARAFYTADAMGLVQKTHDALFRAIHIDHSLKGEGGMDTPEEIAAFYANYGADPKQFVSSMQSFAVAARMNRARQQLTAAYVNGDQMGTPTFVVAGKYRVKGKSVDDMFRILNQLIQMERAKLSGGTAGATPAAPAAASTDPAPAAAPAAAGSGG